MCGQRLWLALLLAYFCAATAAQGSAKQAPKRHAVGRVLVRLRLPPAGQRRLAAAQLAAELPGVEVVRYVGDHLSTPVPPTQGGSPGVAAAAAAAASPDAALGGAVLQLRITDGSSVEMKVQQLRLHPAVDVAEPDTVFKAAVMPTGSGVHSNGAGASSQVAARRRGLQQAAAGTNGSTLAFGLPNDALYTTEGDRISTLAHLTAVQAPFAWRTTTGSTEVKVCVVDTGGRGDHEDLQGNILRGWNRGCLGCSTDPVTQNATDTGVMPPPGTALFRNFSDGPSSHGTHTAGIVGAVGNNGVGVSGVAQKVRLLICKVAAADKYFYLSSIIDCYSLCRQAGARVVSASYSNNHEDADNYSVLQRDAIAALGLANVLLVASSGNFGSNNDGYSRDHRIYPASFGVELPNVLSVAASVSDDSLASFSTYGATTVHLAAPGTVLSTVAGFRDEYAYMTGTSMSCPIVSGAAALLWSAKPAATVAEIKAAILSSVDRVPALVGKTISGGRLNVAQAMATLLGKPTPVPRLTFGGAYRAGTSWQYSYTLTAFTKWEMACNTSDWQACSKRCAALKWCWYWEQGPGAQSLEHYWGKTYRGQCLLFDGTATITWPYENRGHVVGWKTVQVPAGYSPPPRPPQPPSPPLRPPPRSRPRPSPPIKRIRRQS